MGLMKTLFFTSVAILLAVPVTVAFFFLYAYFQSGF